MSEQRGWHPPPWLRDAITRRRDLPGNPPVLREEAGDPKAGDLWLVEPVAGVEERRIVFVVAIYPRLRSATCLLTTHLIEEATDCDVVLPCHLTGLPYQVMVERAVIGPLWFDQLYARVASFGPMWASTLNPVPSSIGRGAVGSGPKEFAADSLAELSGLPIADSRDPRHQFAINEINVMNRLCADCIHRLPERLEQRSRPDQVAEVVIPAVMTGPNERVGDEDDQTLARLRLRWEAAAAAATSLRPADPEDRRHGSLIVNPAAATATLDWVNAERPSLLIAVLTAYLADQLNLARNLADTVIELLLLHAAWSYHDRGREAALEAVCALADARSQVRTLNQVGRKYIRLGQWADATSYLRKCLVLCRRLDDAHGEAQVLRHLGDTYSRLRQWSDAITSYRGSLEIFNTLSGTRGRMRALSMLGDRCQWPGWWEDDAPLENPYLRRQSNNSGNGRSASDIDYKHAGVWSSGTPKNEFDPPAQSQADFVLGRRYLELALAVWEIVQGSNDIEIIENGIFGRTEGRTNKLNPESDETLHAGQLKDQVLETQAQLLNKGRLVTLRATDDVLEIVHQSQSPMWVNVQEFENLARDIRRRLRAGWGRRDGLNH